MKQEEEYEIQATLEQNHSSSDNEQFCLFIHIYDNKKSLSQHCSFNLMEKQKQNQNQTLG